MNERVKSILQNVGWIGAGLSLIVYIIAVTILVIGFENSEKTLEDILMFAITNALVGLVIVVFLLIQGLSIAKVEHKELVEKYYGTTTKDKKAHSLKFFWITTMIKNVLFKGFGVAAATVGIIKIVIEGTNDYTMFLLAGANLIMFVCFGLLALEQAYEFYNHNTVKIMQDAIAERSN